MKSLSLHTFDAGIRIEDAVDNKYFELTQDNFFSRIKSYQTGWVIESADFSDILFEPAGGNGHGQLKINSPFVVNDGANDFDFQFKGDSDDYLLYGDAGNGRVGMGTNVPDEKLHVVGNIKASGTIAGSNLSGTNTGDQSLAAYLTSAAAAAAYQPLDSDLTAIAGLTATTDNFLVAVSNAWASRTPSQVRTTLGLVIGTNVQAWDSDLDTWATKAPPSGTVVGTSDTQTLSGKTFTAPQFADLGFIADANGNEMLVFDLVASAVPYVRMFNAATGGVVGFVADGETNQHISISGKGNGLTKVSILRQDNTTNAYNHNSVVLTGWGIFAQGAASNKSETVTFGITFAARPIVLVSPGGDSLAANTTYGSGANTDKGPISIKAHTIATTSFTAHVHTPDGTSWAATTNVFYQWAAFGEL